MVGMMDKKYIYKHLMKAESDLAKIAFPSGERKFVDIDKLEFEYEEDDITLAAYRNDNKLYVNRRKCLNNKTKNKYDSNFISILQHELIHFYCDEKLNNYKMNTKADASPIFYSVITFFNFRGLNIKTNKNLNETYIKHQESLKNVATDLNITFIKLVEILKQWEKKLYNEIKKYNSLHENTCPRKRMAGNFSRNEDTTSTYQIIKSGSLKSIVFDINLGINIPMKKDDDNCMQDFFEKYTDLNSGLTKSK